MYGCNRDGLKSAIRQNGRETLKHPDLPNLQKVHVEIMARAEAVLMMSDQWTEAFAFTGADALSNVCIQVEASAPSVSRV